jgi:hypothetical protein
VQYCTSCGAPREAAANFCGSCGQAFARAPGAVVATTIDDEPYGSEILIAAALLAVFMPFVALIAALVLRANERRPSRRAFLKSWAIAAGAWMCAVWVFAILFFAVSVSTMSQMP